MENTSSPVGPIRDREATNGQALEQLVVIANPATRQDVSRIISTLEHARPSQVAIEVKITNGPGHATRLAAEALHTASKIIAVGGDGTVAEIVTALRGYSTPLAIIPAGSTNIIAKELNIPCKPKHAVELVYGQHTVRELDVGCCGDQCFLHMAGAGLDSLMFQDTNPQLKRRIGWMAYVGPCLRHIMDRPAQFTIDIDGAEKTFSSRLVLVANGGSIITPSLQLYPEISRIDGFLDLLVFTAASKLDVFRTLGSLLTRRVQHSPHVTRIKGRTIRISSDPPMPVQLDGDPVTRTPCEFRIEPRAIRLVMPSVQGDVQHTQDLEHALHCNTEHH